MPKRRASRFVVLTTAVIAVWVAVAAGAAPLLVDRGGRVLASPRVSAIYFGDHWATREGAGEALHTDAFLQAWIAGPSVTGVLAQYGVGGGSVLGSATVPGGAPAGFTDADAQALVQRELAAGRVAGGDDTVHVLFLPPGTVLTFQGNRAQRTLGGYHSSYRDPVTGAAVVYAVVVYNQGANGLDVSGVPQDNISVMASRVLAGALTNPDVGDVLRGAAPDGVVGWRDDVNGEVGDIAFALSRDARLGDVWGLENGFAVVRLWSNAHGALLAGGAATARIGATATGEPTLSLSPASQEALPGSTVTYTVSNAATSVDTLTISLSTLPDTLTAAFGQTVLAPGASTALTITVAADATAGTTTTLTVTGTGGATAETATASVAVVTALTPAPAPVAAPDFTLTVTPTTQEMTRGGDVATFTATTTQVGSGVSKVKLKTLHVRRGLVVDLSRTRIVAGETFTVIVRAHRDVRRKAYELTLKASSDQGDQRVRLTIVVK